MSREHNVSVATALGERWFRAVRVNGGWMVIERGQTDNVPEDKTFVEEGPIMHYAWVPGPANGWRCGNRARGLCAAGCVHEQAVGEARWHEGIRDCWCPDAEPRTPVWRVPGRWEDDPTD